jgi:hypothetical protein
MDNLVDNLIGLKEDSSEYYHADVELDINIQNKLKGVYYEIEAPKEVAIAYGMELEYRSWGIKDLNVTVKNTIEFDLIIIPEGKDEGKEVHIKIEPLDIKKISWVEGRSYTPSSLDVELDPEGKVVSVELFMYYLVPD